MRYRPGICACACVSLLAFLCEVARADGTSPCATPATHPTTLQPVRYRAVDAHLHLVDFLQKGDGIRAALAAMDRAGVDSAMISGMPLVKKWDPQDARQPEYYLSDDARCYWYSATDVLVARAVTSLSPEDRKRFHPFICGFNGADRNAVDHVRRMIAWYPGLWEGIGEVMARHDDLTALTYGETARADSGALDPVYQLAAELDLPVSVHSNLGSAWKREPVYLDEIEGALRRHPKTRFILCHAGVSRRVELPTLTEDLRRLLTDHANLWVDLSWVVYECYLVRDGRPDPAWVALVEAYPDRFMIGSDKVARFGNYFEEIQKYYFFLDALTPETARKVARENFLRILPKKPATLPDAAAEGSG